MITANHESASGFCSRMDPYDDAEMTPKFINCFWDKEVSGKTYSAGGINGVAVGKTTVEMMSQSTFTNWDFTNTWWIKEGETYPGLWNAGGYRNECYRAPSHEKQARWHLLLANDI